MIRTPQPPRTGLATVGALLLVLILAVVGAATFFGLKEQDATDDLSASLPSTPSPSPPPAICRADGEFVAGFMSPQPADTETRELLETMNTDAVTFGARIVPVETADYPDPVAQAIGGRQAYEYTVTMNWNGVQLAEADQLVQVDETQYGIIDAGNNGAVITESVKSADVFHSLTRVSTAQGSQAFIGLPVPQMQTSGEVWLPDNSYADVIDGFTKKFVAAYAQRGAHGYYLAMEMPLTDVDHWDPVTEYYGRQTAIINTIAPGATVLVSPYLEGRADRETITPTVAARGYEKLLGLANGTHVLVSPQDGLGVGTTALAADESAEHDYTVEEYFAALHQVEPARLYVTIEAMRPGGGSPATREPTSRQRVEAQLDATARFVQGAIGFQWSGPNAMTDIPHIGAGACAAGLEGFG